MKKKIASLPHGAKIKLDLKILMNVLKFSEFKKAKRIAIFLYQGDINTNLLIKKSLELRKILYIPFWHSKKKAIFYKVRTLRDLNFIYKRTKLRRLKEFKGIYRLNLIFAPCLGFDSRGYIIGYGHGDRDRFLSKFPIFNDKEVLLAYSFQRVRKFPVHKFDIPISRIITEKGISKFNKIGL